MLVDVFGDDGSLLHTYPVHWQILNYPSTDADYIAEAKRAVADDQLVPADQLAGLRYVVRRETARSARSLDAEKREWDARTFAADVDRIWKE